MSNFRLSTSLLFLFLASLTSDLWAKSEVTAAIKTYKWTTNNLSASDLGTLTSEKQSNMDAPYQRCLNNNAEHHSEGYFYHCAEFTIMGTTPIGTDFVNGETSSYEIKISHVTHFFSSSGDYDVTNSELTLPVVVLWKCPSRDGSLGPVTNSSGPSNDKEVWCEKIEIESCPV